MPRPADLPPAERFEHGTRARYVSGCRCTECRRANTEAAKKRREEVRALASTVVPSGPPGESTLVRGGRPHRIRTCPGANGQPCVKSPPSWLRVGDVCQSCVERATVWNGVVPADQAKAHLVKLSRVGVGSKSVADAGSLGHSTLAKVKRGKGQVRAKTLRRILEVDQGAIADHALAPPADVRRMKKRIKQLTSKGFRRHHLAKLLGMGKEALQIGKRDAALARTVAAVERLWRRVQRGEVNNTPAARVERERDERNQRELAELRHHYASTRLAAE